MTFASPELAVALTALAAALLVLLDRLRRRPVVLVVAALDLFPETAEAARAAASAQRRAWRDLALKIAAACAFAAGAGGPSIDQGSRGGRTIRVVLSRGASMATREEAGTRLDRARAEVRRALDRLAPEDRVDLELAPRAPDDPPPGLFRDEALRALDRVRVVAAPGPIEGRLDALAAAARERVLDPDAPPALAVTDRPVTLPADLAPLVATVGTPRENRAIVGLGSRRDASGERLLVAVANLADAPASIAVRLRLGGGERLLDLGAVAPGAIASRVIEDPALERALEVEARLDGEDALALDDRVTALRSIDAPVRVALVGTLGTALEKALEAVPGTTVAKLAKVPPHGFDLVIRPWAEDLETTDAATVSIASGAHRVRAPFSGAPDLVSLAPELEVRPEVPRNLGDGWETVLRAGDGTVLIAVKERGDVYLAFTPPASPVGWAALASFPRFWARVVERVRGRPEHASALVAFPTGDPLVVPRPLAAPPGIALSVEGPPPERRGYPAAPFVPLEAGVHCVRAGGETGAFAAALLDPAASDLRGARERRLSDEALAPFAARSRRREPAPVAGWFAALGLALAALAWWSGTTATLPAARRPDRETRATPER